MKKPQIVIVLDGGLVQEVLSDRDVDIRIIDYDTDGSDPNDLTQVPQTGGEYSDAHVRFEEPSINALRVQELMTFEDPPIEDRVFPYITIGLQYRDGCNYKNGDTHYFSNKEGHTLGEIITVFDDNNMRWDGIMVQDYGLRSIAPLDNEFLPTEGDDHPYTEIEEIEGYQPKDGTPALSVEEKDIDEIMTIIKDGGIPGLEAERKVEAKQILENHLKGLDDE